MLRNDTNKMVFYNFKEEDKTDYLWKFVSIDKFLSIILNHKLYFTRLDLFEDSQEGISPDLLLLNYQKCSLLALEPFKELSQMFSVDIFPKATDRLIDQLLETQRLNFANCWYSCKNNVESVAMWHLYSDSNSVALNIKFEDFHMQLQNCGVFPERDVKTMTLGKVKYIDFNDPEEIEKAKKEIAHTAFIKDLSFSYEREFRLVAEIENYEVKPFVPIQGFSKYQQREKYDRNSQVYGFNFKLNDFLNYNFEIVFHPQMQDWVKNDLKNILNKFDIPFKVRDSKLKIK